MQKPQVKTETTPTLGLRDQITELNKKLEAMGKYDKLSKRNKAFKLKPKIRRNLKKVAMRNQLLVFYLRKNKNIDPQICKIKDGLISIDDKYHDCSMDFVFLFQGKTPAIILPEWDLTPIGTMDYYNSLEEGRKVDPQAIIIRAMEAKENQEKKKISGKTVLWIFIGGVIVFYILFAGGGG